MKLKLFAAAALMLICAAFPGCSRSDNNASGRFSIVYAGLSDKWDSNQFMIGEDVIKLPCKLSDVEKYGFSCDESDKLLEPGSATSSFSLKNSSGFSIGGTIRNSTDSPLKYSECYFKDFAVTFSGKNKDFGVIFPGGIKKGSVSDDVISAYGEPTEGIEAVNEKLEIYHYKNDKSTLDITFMDGKLHYYVFHTE